MRTLKTIIAASLFTALTASAAMAQNSNVAVESAEQDRYIIVFNDSVANPGNVAAALARQHGFTVRQTYATALKGFSASLPTRAFDALSRDRRIKYIEADQLAHTNAHLTPTGVMRIFADTNANITINDDDDLRIDVDVAVIDTGVAFHPDINLVGQVDCIGNPFNETCTEGSGNDGNGHGTHVAGTIGALDNGIDVVGVAPGARIWGIKVLKDSGSGWISNIVGGIDWIATHNLSVLDPNKIKVANMSLGGGNSTALCDAVIASVGTGVTYAVAAGNEGADASTSSPANCQVNPGGLDNAPDGIITVSALADFDGFPGGLADSTCRTDVDDTLADFSNHGSMVDIAAPGVCITSTWNDGGLNIISGTSMASPHVAGAAALLASKGGVTPHDIHFALTLHGNFDWVNEGDAIHEPLLDVGSTDLADAEFNPVTVAVDGDPVNQTPTVDITSPGNGDSFANGATIDFAGTATDFEDGTLTANIAWTSSIDGSIGNGGSFSVSLSDGAHTITAEVTDSGTVTGSDSVSITVGDPPPPPENVSMYIADITMEMKGPNLDTALTIRADITGNGVTDDDPPVAGATPEVMLCLTGGSCFFDTATTATNSQGIVKYKLLKPPAGTYTLTVEGIPDISGFVYDGALNVETVDSFDVN